MRYESWFYRLCGYVGEIALFDGVADCCVVFVFYGYVLEATVVLSESFEDASR